MYKKLYFVRFIIILFLALIILKKKKKNRKIDRWKTWQNLHILQSDIRCISLWYRVRIHKISWKNSLRKSNETINHSKHSLFHLHYYGLNFVMKFPWWNDIVCECVSRTTLRNAIHTIVCLNTKFYSLETISRSQ